jgi:hypothetical protein
MRRLLRRMAVLGSVVGVVMALNVGVALAHDAPPFAEAELIADGSGPKSAQAAATTPGAIPVGTALGFSPGGPNTHPGLVHSNGFENLSRNPNCPLHYQS